MFKVGEKARPVFTSKILGLNNPTAHCENSEERAAKYGHFSLKNISIQEKKYPRFRLPGYKQYFFFLAILE